MAQVTLEGVRKVYEGAHGHVAVHGVDLNVADGEFVVLVGPSGCGKSTTLRMIAGLESITAGKLSIGGRVVNDMPPKDRDIAMVFQNYALYPHMSVRDNMAFALKLRKLPKSEIDQRVREAAEVLGLTNELDRLPKQLSGGQRQRVAVGTSDRAQASGVSVRRAAVESRREAPRADAPRDSRPAPPPRRDDGVRHARSGRSDDDGRPHRRDERGPRDAGGHARGALRAAQQPLRGGIHRQPGDALPQRDPNEQRVASLRRRGRRAVDRAARRARVAGAECERCRARHSAGAPAPGEPTRPTGADQTSLQATVDLVEPLGGEALVHVRAGQHELTAKTRSRDLPEVGDRIQLVADGRRVHLFDATLRRGREGLSALRAARCLRGSALRVCLQPGLTRRAQRRRTCAARSACIDGDYGWAFISREKILFTILHSPPYFTSDM